MGFLQLAAEDAGDLAMGVHRHIQGEIYAHLLRHLQRLLVKRIAVDDPFGRPGISHQFGAVEHAHGVHPHDPRTDRLAPPRIPGHKVRFDQRRGDLQIGFQIDPVYPDRRPARRFAYVDQGLLFPSLVVDHPVILGDLLADQSDQFLSFVGSVQPRTHQNDDPLARYTLFFESAQQRRQNGRIGHRTGDVGDDDTGTLPSPGQFPQRRRAERLLQRLDEPLVHPIQSRRFRHLQHLGLVRKFRLQTAAAVIEM